MKKLFSIAIFFLVACGSKTAVPKGILSVNKMTTLLWDVMAADALANNRYPVDSFKRFDTSVVLYQQIAKAHGTTQAQMKKSLQFYEGRPDLLQIILDSLQKRTIGPLPAKQKDTLKQKGKPFQRPMDPLRGLP
jgi:hypothetical protein